jgi:hypothetical protein
MVLGYYYLWVENPILSINPPSELSSERALLVEEEEDVFSRLINLQQSRSRW